MHKYWGSNPIGYWTLVIFNWYLIPMTCLFGRQTFFILVLRTIMKSVEGYGHSLTIFSLDIFSKWYLQSCVDLGLWYNLNNSFSCHTCVLSWFNWCFVQIVSHLVLESLVHAYLLYVYLMACLLSLIQYIG